MTCYTLLENQKAVKFANFLTQLKSSRLTDGMLRERSSLFTNESRE